MWVREYTPNLFVNQAKNKHFSVTFHFHSSLSFHVGECWKCFSHSSLKPITNEKTCIKCSHYEDLMPNVACSCALSVMY